MSRRMTISLNEEQDARLIDWLDQQDNRSQAIRIVLQEHLTSPTIEDVYREVLRISSMLENIEHLPHRQSGDNEANSKAVKALNDLANIA